MYDLGRGERFTGNDGVSMSSDNNSLINQPEKTKILRKLDQVDQARSIAVSYTHLTLPTS